MGLHPGINKGDPITVNRWLKRMGRIIIEGKPRNTGAWFKKGKLVAVMEVPAEEAEARVAVGEDLVNLKRVYGDTIVRFDVDRILFFPPAFWKKATTKNCWLSQLPDNLKESEDNEYES